MNNSNNLFSKIFAIIGLAFFLQACNTPVKLDDFGKQNQPTVQASSGCPTPPIQCKGHVRYPICSSVLSSTLQNFDIIIQVDNWLWPCLPAGCKCRELHLCVTLDIPPRAVLHAAKVGIDEPLENYVTLEPNGMGGYIGHENPLTLGPNGQGNNNPPQNYVHEICFQPGDQLMFQLDSAIVSQYDLSKAVISAGGLCIITDIHNPGIAIETPPTACTNWLQE